MKDIKKEFRRIGFIRFCEKKVSSDLRAWVEGVMYWALVIGPLKTQFFFSCILVAFSKKILIKLREGGVM